MYNTEHGQSEYGREYARCAPIFRQMWQEKSIEECAHALTDIHFTLAGRETDGYAGRLYAELDSVRDRMMVLKREEV